MAERRRENRTRDASALTHAPANIWPISSLAYLFIDSSRGDDAISLVTNTRPKAATKHTRKFRTSRRTIRYTHQSN
jgi:hypothetical protein